MGFFGGSVAVPVAAPEGSSASADVPALPRAKRFLETPLGVGLALVLCAILVWVGLGGDSSFSASSWGGASDATSDAKKDPKSAAGKPASKPAPAAKSPSKSPRPKPSPSPTSTPASDCTCAIPENDKGASKTILHFLPLDSKDAMVQGVTITTPTGQFSTLDSCFALVDVTDITSKDPAYAGGRSVTLYRPLGPFNAAPNQNFGHEFNLVNQPALQELFGNKVRGQMCHTGTPPPVYLYVDAHDDSDAGLWLGESAPFLVDRWINIQAKEKDAKLLFKAPAPHKTAMMQLLGIPEEKVLYISKEGHIPCEKGNKVYIPPLMQYDQSGWSLQWAKKPNYLNLLKAALSAASLPWCPKAPLELGSGEGIVLVPLTEAEEALAPADKDDTFKEYVKSVGGTVAVFPESLKLKAGGSEMTDYVTTVASARVLILHAAHSVGFHAGLARGATIFIIGGKGGAAKKVLDVPGRAFELGLVKKKNNVVLLSAGEDKGLEELKGKIQEIKDGKEKPALPAKCPAIDSY